MLNPTRLPRTTRMALAAATLAAFLSAAAHAEEIKLGGTGAALGTMRILANAYTRQHPEVSFKVLPSLGSGGGINAVLAGAIEVAVSSRPLKDGEKQPGINELEYGRTPVVFATPAAGKATEITTQALVEIYGGRVETWPDGSRIRLVLRPLGDADSEIIKSISPALREAKAAAESRKGMLFTITDQETADYLEKIPGALGPTTLAQILSEKRALRALTFNGVVPSAKSVEDGTYTLYKQMFMISDAKASPAVKGFVSFVRSPAGRDILTETGHWAKP